MRMPKDLEKKNRSQDSTRSLLSHRLRCRETKRDRTSHWGRSEFIGVAVAWLAGGLRGEYVEPKEPAGALDAWKGEFHLTAYRTLGTMSASRRHPLPHFQPGMAAV